MKSIYYAPEAWKFLNGIFCIYKPSGLPMIFVRNTLAFNVCRDLNQMEKRAPQKRVLLKGSVTSAEPFAVEVVPNYADLELVVGPRYQSQDVRLKGISKIGKYTCGVSLMAVNDGCRDTSYDHSKFLSKYEVKGRFGLATDNFMEDGKVRERSTFGHIRQVYFDRLLASIQASHQALAYQYSGIDIQSQEAYELASKGLIRPSGKSEPIMYSIKCTEFNLPNFSLEIHCINETELFLSELIHQLGIYMKSTAICTQLRRTQFGSFTLDHALLRKHWTVEHIINNIGFCRKIRDHQVPDSAHFERVAVSRTKEIMNDLREDARSDML